jgi:putative phosphoribosyl transferase
VKEVIMNRTSERDITIETSAGKIHGTLGIPEGATGIVVFAHGSGSSRHSPRNRDVAAALQEAGFATFLFDLLTAQEDAVDQNTREYRFNIPLLGSRLVTVTDWLHEQPETAELAIGYFGASTGAAAALIAASKRADTKAVVSRGGRPDLAGDALEHVAAPTLLIVGGDDEPVIGMNERAKARLQGVSELVIVPGATHLFEEPGTMEQVIEHATEWFRAHLAAG